MSQDRQSVKDRVNAAHDYEVNLKAELEILSLHEKLDELPQEKLDGINCDAARTDTTSYRNSKIGPESPLRFECQASSKAF